MQAAIEAVAEVGNPTVVATLTVIAALLPMLFVSGLMGPYMAPIPANASAAMLFSFFVAMVVAPWLMCRLHPERPGADAAARIAEEAEWLPAASPGMEHDLAAHHEGRLGRLYRAVATPLLRTRTRAWSFLIGVGLATIAACTLFYTENVTVKLLPFDNKSELAVEVNLPEGSSLEDTERALFAAARIARALPELRSVQAYAGTAAPFNFNGLVRHYYLRQSPELGDLQLNLTDKSARQRSSHAIALDLRQRLRALKLPEGSTLQGGRGAARPAGAGDAAGRDLWAGRRNPAGGGAGGQGAVQVGAVHRRCRPTPTAIRVRGCASRIDQDQLEYFGVEQSDVYDTIQALFGGVPVGYSHRGEERDPIDIVVGLPKRDLSWDDPLASTPVPANTVPGSKTVVELGEVVRARARSSARPVLFRRDGHFADMVMGELAGAFEAPIYGMLAVDKAIARHDWGKLAQARRSACTASPTDESQPDAAVGRRVGDHLGHLPRHGRGVRRGDAGHLHPGGRAVRQLQAAAGDPDADPADADRHRARATGCSMRRSPPPR